MLQTVSTPKRMVHQMLRNPSETSDPVVQQDHEKHLPHHSILESRISRLSKSQLAIYLFGSPYGAYDPKKSQRITAL